MKKQLAMSTLQDEPNFIKIIKIPEMLAQEYDGPTRVAFNYSNYSDSTEHAPKISGLPGTRWKKHLGKYGNGPGIHGPGDTPWLLLLQPVLPSPDSP